MFLDWNFLNKSFNYFFFIIILNFSFFMNLFADFFKFTKCRLFNKNSTKSICLKWILNNLSTILHSRFNYHTLPVTPFKNGSNVEVRTWVWFSANLQSTPPELKAQWVWFMQGWIYSRKIIPPPSFWKSFCSPWSYIF